MYNQETIGKYFIQNNKNGFSYYAIVGYDFAQDKYITFSPNKMYHALPENYEGGVVCTFSEALQILSDTIEKEKETLEYILNMKNMVLNKLNKENYKNEYYHLLNRYQETKKQIKSLKQTAQYYEDSPRLKEIEHDIKKSEKGLRNAKKRIYFFCNEETENILHWLDADKNIGSFETKIYQIGNQIKRLEFTLKNMTAFHNLYIYKENQQND